VVYVTALDLEIAEFGDGAEHAKLAELSAPGS
jgi:hypothetical protein